MSAAGDPAAGEPRAPGQARLSSSPQPGPVTMSTAQSQPSQANARKQYEVRRAALPLSCPLPSMGLWNSHPRVYLPIESDGGQADCPYCSAHFVLVD